MQKAEKMVTIYDEFRNNTLYVPTAQFMNYPGTASYNGEYHYFGRADVYYHIGRAFGKGMLKFMGTVSEKASHPISFKPVTHQALSYSITSLTA